MLELELYEPQIKQVRRWRLVGTNLNVNCGTKENAIRWGRMARQAGGDISLIEEYDLFDRDVLIDHQEFDRTNLIVI